MSEIEPGAGVPRPHRLRRLLNVPVEIVVAIYLVLDGLVAPLFGPIMRGLSRLRLVHRLEATIARLPPYVILVLLVVPFGVAELAKVYAVLLMAEDHVRTGMTIFVGAYIVSILVCERTFQAGRDQLMTIGWFKTAFDWLMALRRRIVAWFRETQVWRAVAVVRDKARKMLERRETPAAPAFDPEAKGLVERR